MSRFSYKFVVLNGDFYDGQSWVAEFPASESPPPDPVDLANIDNGGTAAASGGVSTADGGTIIVSNNSTLTVYGPLIFAATGASGSSVGGGSTLNAYGSLIIASGPGSSGALTITGAGTTANTESSALTIGDAGTGTLTVSNLAKVNADGSILTLASQKGSNGFLFVSTGSTFKALALRIGAKGNANVSVDGAGSTLTAGTVTVGGQKATATGDPNNPWTYSGGMGSLAVSSNGIVMDTGKLSLLGGTIDIPTGGALEVGGSSGPATNTLKIDNGGSLKGFGTIASTKTGSDTVGATTPVPTWSLNVANGGTIEANDGTLKIQGNVSGTNSDLKIDDNSTLDIGGSLAGTIDYQGAGLDSGTSTLVLDNMEAILNGENRNDQTAFNIENLVAGDSIVLDNTSYSNDNGVRAATIGQLDGQTVLEIREAPSPTANGSDIIEIPINNAPTNMVSQDYFQVSQSGNNTVLTFTKGQPIATAVQTPESSDGAGVKIGIISTNLVSSEMQAAINQGDLSGPITIVSGSGGGAGVGNDDEGLSMAETIHQIAPGASLYFDSGFDSGKGNQATMSGAITALANAGCNIIVDDLSFFKEPNTASVIQSAITSAVLLHGVTYVTAAGNFRQKTANHAANPIWGHQLDPWAESVAAMNLLSTPTAAGNYIVPQQTEPFSSLGPPGSGKPDITGPDAGPTTNGLLTTNLDPFFGTSAASPAVAAVAALMMQSNRQLQNNPLQVYKLLNTTAQSIGQPFSKQGFGLVNATAAVNAAGDPPIYFVGPTVQSTPVVASAYLSQPAGDANTGSVIQIVVQLGDGVTVTGGTPALLLNNTVSATASYDAAASDPGSGSLMFDYTVGAADHFSNLEVTGYSSDGATIEDAHNVAADFSNLDNVPTGLSINSPVSVTGISVSSGANAVAGGTDVTSGGTVQIALRLTSGGTAAPLAVSGGGGLTLILDDNASATYDAANSNLSGGKLTFDYTVGGTDETPNLSVMQVDLASGTTVTLLSGGYNADFSSASSFNTGIVVGAAFVGNYTTTSGTAFYSGQKVQLTLDMSEGHLTVSGTPKLILDDGASATYDASASNLTSGALVFDYTVGTHDESPDLYVSGSNLNGSSINIKDSFGNEVDLGGIVNVPTGLQIGQLGLLDVQTSVPGAYAHTGQALTIELDFGGPLTVNTAGGTPTLTLNDSATATYDAILSDPAGGFLIFDYTVRSQDHTPNLTISKVNLNGATVEDTGGHAVDFSAAPSLPTGLTINSPLTVTGVGGGFPVDPILSTGQTAEIDIGLSEATVVSGGTPTLTLNDGEIATYDSGSSTFFGMVFDYTVASGGYATALGIASVNLNGATVKDFFTGDNADFTSAITTVDDTLWNVPFAVNTPVVSSIAASQSGIVSGGEALTLTMSMTGAVAVDTGGGTPTLDLSDGDVATYDSGASNPSSGLLLFDVTLAADATPGALTVTEINLNGGTIDDPEGNPVNFKSPYSPFNLPYTPISIGAVVGPEYVSGFSASVPGFTALSSGSTAELTVTFNGGVTVDRTSGSPTLLLDDGGTAFYDSGSSTPSSGALVFDYTVSGGNQTSDLQAKQIVLNGATITDALGNVDTDIPLHGQTFITVGPISVASLAASVDTALTGQTLFITLRMDNELSINTTSGSPILELSNGGTATFDASATMSSFNQTLVFDYTVAGSGSTNDLLVDALNSNGATISGLFGATADFPAVNSAQLNVAVNTPEALWASTNAQTPVVSGGQVVEIAVGMNEGVTVSGGTPTLTLSTGSGTETATYDSGASNPSGGYLTFDYTVSGGDVTPDLQIASFNSNGATIKDSAGHAAVFSGMSGFDLGLAVNSPIAPTITGVIGTSIHLSEPVTVDLTNGVPTLTLSDGGTATYDIDLSSPQTGGLVFDYTPPASDSPQLLNVDRVNLNGSTITDALGNAADFSNVSQFPTGSFIGPLPVTPINPSLSVTPGVSELDAGQSVELTLALGESVLLSGGTPSLILNNGGTAIYNSSLSDPFLGNLVFDYTLRTGGTATTLGADQLDLNGATLTDDFGRTVVLGGLGGTSTQLGPGVVAPGIIDSPEEPTLTTGQTVTLTVNMYGATVTSGSLMKLDLSDGETATYAGGSNGPLVFDYTVTSGHFTPALAVTGLTLNGATIKDANGVNVDLAGIAQNVTAGVGPNELVDVAVNAPSIVEAFATAAATTPVLVTGQSTTIFLGLGFSDLVTVNTTSGSPTLTLNDGGTATYDAAQTSNVLVAFDYTVGSGESTESLQISSVNLNGATIEDSAGHSAGLASVNVFPLRLAINVPTVTSVTPSQTSRLLAGQSVSIMLTLDEGVTVNTSGGSPTLSLDDGSIAAYVSGSSNPASGTLVFDYTAGSTDFTPDLTVIQFNLNGAIVQDANDRNADFAGARVELSVPVGTTAYVSGGATSSGATVSAGRTLDVLPGGTAIDTTLSSGGSEVINSGGRDAGAQVSGGEQDVFGFVSGATVSSGGSQEVEAGGTADDTTVLSGGTLDVLFGGFADPATISSGGTETVRVGGTDDGALISGGTQFVYGLASGAVVFAGAQVIEAGGTASATTVSSGGTVELLAGGTESNIHLLPGGTLVVVGALSGFTVSSDGTLQVSGGTVSKTTVLNGGTLELLDGATQSATTINSGGVLEIGSGDVLSSYSVSRGITLAAVSGGVVSSATVAGGGTLDVLSGGTATSATVNSGGLEVVFGGGAGSDAVMKGGTIELIGSNTAQYHLSAGATLEVGSGYVFSGTISSGITAKVLSGGTDFSVTIASGGTVIVSAGGTDIDATVSRGGKLIVASGATDIGPTISAGGSAVVSSGGVLELVGTGTTSGLTLLSGGTLEVDSGSTLSNFTVSKGITVDVLSGGTAFGLHVSSGGLEIVSDGGFDSGAVISSGGALEAVGSAVVSGDTFSKGAIVEFGSGFVRPIDAHATQFVVLSGGFASGGTAQPGVVVLVRAGGVAGGLTVDSGGKLIAASGGTAIGPTISAGGSAIVSSGGVVELVGANTTSGLTLLSGATLEVGSGYTLSNFKVSKGVNVDVLSGGTAFGLHVSAGGVEVVSDGGFDSGATISSGGVLEAIGTAVVSGDTFSKGAIIEFGSGFVRPIDAHASEFVVLSGGFASGGTAQSGVAVLIRAGGVASGLTVGSGGSLIVSSGGIASGSTIASGGTEIVSSGGTDIGVTSIGTGGMLETASGGTAIVSGTVTNSGTLIASGRGSLMEIVNSAVVNGGKVEVGNGIVDVLSGGTANVAFLSSDSGGLEIADTNVSSSTFTGTITGFGGVNHTNHKQFIDLVSVTSAPGQITSSYVSSGGSGTLTVSSGGQLMASIEMIGTYTSASFHITSGISGTVKITDPGIVNGGSVDTSATSTLGGHRSVFATQTTLAYSENGTSAGGTLTVTDGRHAAAIALLGNYMAASFAPAADGHGGTLVTEAQQQQQQQQPLLTHPHPT